MICDQCILVCKTGLNQAELFSVNTFEHLLIHYVMHLGIFTDFRQHCTAFQMPRCLPCNFICMLVINSTQYHEHISGSLKTNSEAAFESNKCHMNY